MSIHQESLVATPPQRLFELLTDGTLFAAATRMPAEITTLEPTDDGTHLVIDHTSIPPEWIDHITEGYPTFYQEPITKYLTNCH